jgi:hypothetical protein
VSSGVFEKPPKPFLAIRCSPSWGCSSSTICAPHVPSTQRGFAETSYRAKSWKTDRRACARIEATTKGLDIRFVVTSIQTGSAEHLYETLRWSARLQPFSCPTCDRTVIVRTISRWDRPRTGPIYPINYPLYCHNRRPYTISIRRFFG